MAALIVAVTGVGVLTAVGPTGADAAGPTARGMRVGLVDSVYYSADVKDETLNAPWRNLHAGLARIAVPFDIATRPTDDPVRYAFDRWLTGVLTARAEPYVTFMAVNPPKSKGWGLFYDNWHKSLAHKAGSGHCYAYSNGETHCNMPSLGTYTNAVRRFVNAKAYRAVHVIGAWNEPDYTYKPKSKGGTGRRYFTPDNIHEMSQPNCGRHPSVNSCGPDLAAHYWTTTKQLLAARGCAAPTCLVAAGEFTAAQPAPKGAPNYGYFGSYAYYLRALHWRPYIWAIHPYGEARRGNATTTAEVLSGGSSGVNYLGPKSPMYRTNELPAAASGLRPTSHLWDSAAGVPNAAKFAGARATTCHSSGQRYEQGARLACWLRAVHHLNSASGPYYARGRVPRAYVYDFQNRTCKPSMNDVALVCPGKSNTAPHVVKRDAYYVVRNLIAEFGH